MTTKEQQELDNLRAENARLEAGLRAAVSAAQVREAQQQIAMSLLQAENARLLEALQRLDDHAKGCMLGATNLCDAIGADLVTADLLRARDLLRDLGEL